MAEELMRPERLQIMLNPEELKAVDDFRFHSRMPSRAAAVRELLKRGLAAEGFEIEIAATGMKSQSFGVLGRSASASRAAAGDDGTSGEPSQG
jgi:hypothetical protein